MAGCALLIGLWIICPTYPAFIAHAEPMILIHGLVELGETWLIAASSLSRPTLFTGPSGTPAYVALEYMAQAIAAYAGSQNAARNLPPKSVFTGNSSLHQRGGGIAEPGHSAGSRGCGIRRRGQCVLVRLFSVFG